MGTVVTPEKADIYIEDISYRGSVSEELLRKIAASVNAINHGSFHRIGSSEMSFLTISQFQEIWDNSWVLADGTDITSTDYGQYLISKGAVAPIKLPDLRGQVPVGINNGRADGKQNTVVPGLGLGQQMGDGVKSHSHAVQRYTSVSQPFFAGSESQISEVMWFGNTSVQTGSTGQSQNTVNSVGVNWFIKVWNSAQS